MIKTKSVYFDKIDPDDGLRLLIMRKWPRGIGWEKNKIDKWMKDLAPSTELLNDWNQKKIDFKEYTKRYLEEMKAQEDKINELRQLAKDNMITLLCHEKGDNECHRRLLKDLIEG